MAKTPAEMIAEQVPGYGTVREYIGARYVPVFANPIEWSDTKGYEPLTIVTHQGNSYTSMQAVPPGIDIANTAFWALTGNYNAQIEQYRAEVRQYQQTVGEFADDIADNMADIAEIEKTTNKLKVSDAIGGYVLMQTDTSTKKQLSLVYYPTADTADVRNNLTALVNALSYFVDGELQWTINPASISSSKAVTDKLTIASSVQNVSFPNLNNANNTPAIIFNYGDSQIGMYASENGFHVYDFTGGRQILWLRDYLAKLNLAASDIDGYVWRSAASGSGQSGINLTQYFNPEHTEECHFNITDRSLIYYQNGVQKWGFNPVRSVSYPLTNLQVAYINNVAVISCNGIDINLSDPAEWQIIATPSQLGITAAAGESVYGACNVDYEGGSSATLRFNNQGLAIRASGVTAGSHNVYGQICAIINVTFPATAAAYSISDENEEPPSNDTEVTENEELMTFYNGED